MVKKKAKSKRTTLQQKYKIVKKVREHNRKLRKDARKNGGKQKKTKDPGIPNSWPYKEQILLDIEATKQREAEEKLRQKELRKREKLREQRERKREKEVHLLQAQDALAKRKKPARGKDEIKSAIKESDLVLIVLDARDPQGSRPLSLEMGLVAKEKKKVALVLNKIDLVPRDVVRKWLGYLGRIHPVVAIQASSGSSADVVMNKSRKRKANDLQNASALLKEKLQSTPATRDRGYVEPLKKFLDEFSSATQKETPKVCLLGYANVGKSSIINALRGKDVAETGFAAHTQAVEKFQVSGGSIVLDCPPIPSALRHEEAVIAKYIIGRELAVDAVDVACSIIEHCNRYQVMSLYKLPLFKTAEQCIRALATKKSMFIKVTGEPDTMNAARAMFQEMERGKVLFYCQPPAGKSTETLEMPEWFNSMDNDEIQIRQTATLERSPPSTCDQSLAISPLEVSAICDQTVEYDRLFGLISAEDVPEVDSGMEDSADEAVEMEAVEQESSDLSEPEMEQEEEDSDSDLHPEDDSDMEEAGEVDRTKPAEESDDYDFQKDFFG